MNSETLSQRGGVDMSHDSSARKVEHPATVPAGISGGANAGQAKTYWTVPVPPSINARSVPPAGNNIVIEIVNETTPFLALRNEWDELVSQTAATVFQTFDWQYLWWKHFGATDANHLHIILFRDSGRLVGIAPFFIQSYAMFHFRIFRRMMLLGSGLHSPRSPILSLEKQGPTDYLDIIAAPGYEKKVVGSLIDLLVEEDHLYDEIELQNIPEYSLTLTHAMEIFSGSKKFLIRKEPEDLCPIVTLGDSLDKYLAGLRRSVRRNLRYVQRGFLENKEYSVEDPAEKGNIDGAIQVLTKLHQKRWNGIGYPGLFSDRRFGPFLQDVAKAFGPKKKLWFRTLRHEDRAIASHLCFTFNGRLHTYATGFDRDAASASGASGAGMALTMLELISSINSGFHTIDTGRGTESYKFQLTSRTNQNWRITIDPLSHDGRSVRLAVFGLRSSAGNIVARANCERTILRTIANERGKLRAIPGYSTHLVHRITGNEQGASSSPSSIYAGVRQKLGAIMKHPSRPAEPRSQSGASDERKDEDES